MVKLRMIAGVTVGVIVGALVAMAVPIAHPPQLAPAPVVTAGSGTRPSPGDNVDRSFGGEMWGASYFPNIELVTHRGERVRFFDDLIRDKVVAINFIYTTCTDACPMETARMVEVEKLLGARLGDDVFFYSISIDPVHDTPDVLRAYARTWNTGPGWTFLTGKEAEITQLRKKLGVYDPDLKKRDHGLSLVIGNQKTGRWMKRSPGENPYVLANELGSWLHNWKHASPEDRDFAHAPAIRNISTGEELFRARCAACHTVGGGDRLEVDDRRIGPDLLDVDRKRDRAWLTRWLIEPDKVLAERDPTAVELATRYKNVPMPNLRLTAADAALVLRYLEDESRGVQRRARAVASAAGPLDPATRALVRELVTAYEHLAEAFAADDAAGVRAQATTVERQARRAAAHTDAARSRLELLADDANRVAGATELEVARQRFGDVSQQVVALVVGDPALRDGQFLFVCAMAPGY